MSVIALAALLAAQDVDLLVERLGAATYAERRKAVERLAESGRKARPALEKAARGTDPEVAARAVEALERMGWPLALRDERLQHEEAVEAALGWLARTPPEDPGVKALAELAFLGAGRIRKDPLEALAAAEPRGPKPMYARALAALALVEAHGLAEDERWREPARRAVDALLAARHPGKGWGYGTGDPATDSSVTFWAALALWAARGVGLEPPAGVFNDIRGCFDAVTERVYGLVGYRGPRTRKLQVPAAEDFDGHESMTAHGVVLRRLLRVRGRFPDTTYLARDWPREDAKAVDYYYWHAAALALRGLPEGRGWREELEKVLLRLQRPDGSWDPSDRWGPEGGRAYSTSMAALALQAPRLYRLGPLPR